MSETVKSNHESVPGNSSNVLTEMPEFNKETAAQAVAKAESAKKSEAVDLSTGEGRKTANRDEYNALVQRRGFLRAEFKSGRKACPDSVSDELQAIENLMIYLDNGVTAHIHGAEKVSYGGEAVVVDSFHHDKFQKSMEQLQSARAINSELTDPKAEAAFKLPVVDLDDLKQKIESSKTTEDVMHWQNKLISYEEVADLDTLYQLRKLNRNTVNTKLEELSLADGSASKEVAAKRYDDLMTDLSKDFIVGGEEGKALAAKIVDLETIWQTSGAHFAEAKSQLAKLDDEKHKMGFFKKIATAGSRRKERKTLERQMDIARVQTTRANREMAQSLAYAYGIHPDSIKDNSELNDKFFGGKNADKITLAQTIQSSYFSDKFGKNILKSKEFSENYVHAGKSYQEAKKIIQK